jgi:hypothetical protein
LRELVVAGSDATPILEPTETTFDNVAAFVGFFVMMDFLFAIGFARDDGLDALLLEKGADRVGIVTFVGEELFDAGQEADAFLCHHAIGGIARREDERPGPAGRVDDRVDLAVAAAFRKPDRLKIRPPFPPLAQRCTLTWLESNAACSGGSAGAATDSKIFFQMPRSLQREKRL